MLLLITTTLLLFHTPICIRSAGAAHLTALSVSDCPYPEEGRAGGQPGHVMECPSWCQMSAVQPWQQLRATDASAEKWYSRWAASAGSPGRRCQESHGWCRGSGESMERRKQEAYASSMLLCINKKMICQEVTQLGVKLSSHYHTNALQMIKLFSNEDGGNMYTL